MGGQWRRCCCCCFVVVVVPVCVVDGVENSVCMQREGRGADRIKSSGADGDVEMSDKKEVFSFARTLVDTLRDRLEDAVALLDDVD